MDNSKRSWTVQYTQINDKGPSFRRGQVSVDDADDEAPSRDERVAYGKKTICVYHPVPDADEADERDRILAYELCEAWLKAIGYPNATFG